MSHNYDIRGPNLEFISPDFEFLSGNGIFIFAPYFRKIIIIQKKVISNKMCNYLSFTLFIIYFYLFHIIRIILFNRIIPDNPFSHRFRIRKLSFEYFFGYAWSYFQKENYELTGISRQKSSRAILTSHVTSPRPIDVFLLQTNILEIDQAIIWWDYPYYFQYEVLPVDEYS